MSYVNTSVWWALCLCLLSACPQDGKHTEPALLSDAGEPEADEPRARERDAGAGKSEAEHDAGAEPHAGDEPFQPAAAGSAAPGSKPTPAAMGSNMTPKPSDKPSTPASMQPQPPAAATPFFLPTKEPTNTTAPHLLRDARGGTHALYSRYTGGGAFYAYCATDACGPDDFHPVLLPTENVVTNSALALTPDGKPRALLSTLLHVYYAECNERCSDESQWTTTLLVDHQGAQDVTGQALAMDPQGRPRFVMHTYLAYLGVGQKAPRTWFAQCDAGCNEASHWRFDEISQFILYGSELQYDETGRAHLLTGIENVDGKTAGFKQGAYFQCESGCESSDGWNGLGLVPLFENDIQEIPVTMSLALTQHNQPRVVLLARDDTFQRHLMYLECDDNCIEDNWRVTTLNDSMKLGPGLDLSLDSQERPRFTLTLEDNIGLYTCNEAQCAANGANWTLNKVEFATDVPPDSIILWWNCTVDAWILHSPSLALSPDGRAQVAYVATDLSGGVAVVDPMKPRCEAGKDMTLTRMTSVTGFK